MTHEMQKVTISAAGISPVVVLLGETPPNIPSGYGGWVVETRSRRVGLTVWNGKDPLRFAVPVLFDGVRDQISQETDISRLSRMALPPTTGGAPPTVQITGRGLQNPGPKIWVIENLVWGDNVIRDFASNGVMARLRQDCVINLLEYRAEDITQFRGIQPGKVTSSKTTASTKSTSGWPKTYVVKSGDTLSKIAAHFYGSSSKWHQIANANNIRDPQKLTVGAKLRIPAP
jgi:hypothetical protein